LLVSTAAERVGRYLAPPPPDPRPFDSHRSEVASLADHGLRFAVKEVSNVVRTAAARQLGTLEARLPDENERKWQRKLLTSRYHHPLWHSDGRQRDAPRKQD
jgi:lipoate-protein ligase A